MALHLTCWNTSMEPKYNLSTQHTKYYSRERIYMYVQITRGQRTNMYIVCLLLKGKLSTFWPCCEINQ